MIDIHNISRTSIFAYGLTAVSLLVLLSTVYFVFTIDVVTKWRLIMPDGPIHAGETVIVKSEYTKLRDVKGRATRYIECWTPSNVLVSYPINQAVADRSAGVGGTGLVLAIPANIPNTPAKCRFRVHVSYPVLPLREVEESNHTKWFDLLPPREASTSQPVSATATSGSQAQGIASAPGRSSGIASSSSPQSAPSRGNAQSNNLQPEPSTSEPIPEPRKNVLNIPVVTPLLNAFGIRT